MSGLYEPVEEETLFQLLEDNRTAAAASACYSELIECHLHGFEDGPGVDLIVTAATLVVEDLLRVRLSAQQLQFAQRHFKDTNKPLNHRLLLLPAI